MAKWTRIAHKRGVTGEWSMDFVHIFILVVGFACLVFLAPIQVEIHNMRVKQKVWTAFKVMPRSLEVLRETIALLIDLRSALLLCFLVSITVLADDFLVFPGPRKAMAVLVLVEAGALLYLLFRFLVRYQSYRVYRKELEDQGKKK